mmetsp:Transcript_5026/g.16546  ORF Transcript_5026/g.16546 Transcript_5026/m.16546 type:complete len:223 (-) Transcript_5026:295-963(-)
MFNRGAFERCLRIQERLLRRTRFIARHISSNFSFGCRSASLRGAHVLHLAKLHHRPAFACQRRLGGFRRLHSRLGVGNLFRQSRQNSPVFFFTNLCSFFVQCINLSLQFFLSFLHVVQVRHGFLLLLGETLALRLDLRHLLRRRRHRGRHHLAFCTLHSNFIASLNRLTFRRHLILMLQQLLQRLLLALDLIRQLGGKRIRVILLLCRRSPTQHHLRVRQRG